AASAEIGKKEKKNPPLRIDQAIQHICDTCDLRPLSDPKCTLIAIYKLASIREAENLHHSGAGIQGRYSRDVSSIRSNSLERRRRWRVDRVQLVSWLSGRSDLGWLRNVSNANTVARNHTEAGRTKHCCIVGG